MSVSEKTNAEIIQNVFYKPDILSNFQKTSLNPADSVSNLIRKFYLATYNNDFISKGRGVKLESDDPLEYQTGIPQKDLFSIEHNEAELIIFMDPFKKLKSNEMPLELKENIDMWDYVSGCIETQLANNNSYEKSFANNRALILEESIIKIAKDYMPQVLKDISKRIQNYQIPDVLSYLNIFYRKEISSSEDSAESNKSTLPEIVTKVKENFNSQQKEDIINEQIYIDFLSRSSLFANIFFYTVINKMLDGAQESLLIENTFYYDHYQNYTISPLAPSFSLYFKINPSNDEAKITYISFSGVLSELEIEILNLASPNFQIIVLYDENTENNNNSNLDKIRSSQNVILLPIPVRDPKQKVLHPSDFLMIFRTIIQPLIMNFSPNLVVLSIALIFTADSTPFHIDPITYGKIIRILKVCSNDKLLIFPFKISKNLQEFKPLFKELMKFNPEKFKENDFEIMEYNLTNYGGPYNRKYFRASIVNIRETMSGIKKPNKYASSEIKTTQNLMEQNFESFFEITHPNPMVLKCFEIWEEMHRFTKVHSIFLSSVSRLQKKIGEKLLDISLNNNKEFGSLLFKDLIGKQNQVIDINFKSELLFKNQYSKKIPILIKDRIVFIALKDYYMTEDSQYLVDYDEDPNKSENKKNILIFIINLMNKKKEELAFIKITISQEKLLGKLDHYTSQKRNRIFNQMDYDTGKRVTSEPTELCLEESEDWFELKEFLSNLTTEYQKKFNEIQEKSPFDAKNAKKKVLLVKNVGLYYFEGELFFCYGNVSYRNEVDSKTYNEDVGHIFILNTKRDEMKELTLKYREPTKFPRINPSVCIFKQHSKIFIVLTSGETSNPYFIRDHYYDMYNLVEVYHAFVGKDVPAMNESFDYTKLEKDPDHLIPHEIGYKSYLNSYMFQENNTLMIFGGTGIEGSVDEWNMNCYEIELDEKLESWKFVSHKIFLNQTILGDQNSPSMTRDDFVAIGDSNRNIKASTYNSRRHFDILYQKKDRCYHTHFEKNIKVYTGIVQAPISKEELHSPTKSSEKIELDITAKIHIPYLSVYCGLEKEFNNAIDMKLNSKGAKSWSDCAKSVFNKKDYSQYEPILSKIFSADYGDNVLNLIKLKLKKNNFSKTSAKSIIIQNMSDISFQTFKKVLLGIQKYGKMVKTELEKILKTNSNSLPQPLSQKASFLLLTARTMSAKQNSSISHGATRYTDSKSMGLSHNSSRSTTGSTYKNLTNSFSSVSSKQSSTRDTAITSISHGRSTDSARSSVQGYLYNSAANISQLSQRPHPNFQTASQDMVISTVSKNTMQQEEFKIKLTYFLNKEASEISILYRDFSRSGIKSTLIRLKFKIAVKNLIQNISFKLSPHSLCIHGTTIYGLIDSEFLHIDPSIAEFYSNCIVSADLAPVLEELTRKKKVEEIVFRKLFKISRPQSIMRRCLIKTDRYFYLIGGVMYTLESDDPKELRSGIWRIDPSKSNNDEVDEEDLGFTFEEKSSSYRAVQVMIDGQFYIFACQQTNPKFLYQLNENGAIKKKYKMKDHNLNGKIVADIFKIKDKNVLEKNHIMLALRNPYPKCDEQSEEKLPNYVFLEFNPKKKEFKTKESIMKEIELENKKQGKKQGEHESIKEEIESYRYSDQDTMMLDNWLDAEDCLYVRRYDESEVKILSLNIVGDQY